MRGGSRDEALGSPSLHLAPLDDRKFSTAAEQPQQHVASPKAQHVYSVPTLDELIEKSRHDAIVNLQRW